MSNKVLVWVKSFIEFSKLTIGIAHTPYQTYRSIAWKPDVRHIVPIALLILLYLAFSTLVRGGLRASPLFLTASFTKAYSGVLISFLYSVSAILVLSHKLSPSKQARVGEFEHKTWQGKEGEVVRIGVLWAFTLIPTIFWFLTMSVFYYLLPPPRTPSILGQIASAFFIGLSLALLIWKVMLYYLTLRFGMRMSMEQITLFSLLFLPLTVVYSLMMYAAGIFRVPFL